MKIVVLDGYAANPNDLSWEPMRKLGELTVYDRTTPKEVEMHIGDAEAVLTNKVIITEELMKKKTSLRYIGVLATGYNVVDIPAAKAFGIVVTNIPAYSTTSVAQHVFALLLELCVHVGHHSDAVHAGRWTNSRDFCFWDMPLMELNGKTMGIIGYGRIGQAVEKLARAFGMQVRICSGHAQVPDVVPLETLLAESDVVSLHCPLTKDNAGLIDRNALEKMKNGAILINTARGGLVNESDIRAALESGKLAGFAADVAQKEPIPADSPLLGAPNCVLTPHIAWAPKEARQRLMDIAVSNLAAWKDGHPVNNVAK